MAVGHGSMIRMRRSGSVPRAARRLGAAGLVLAALASGCGSSGSSGYDDGVRARFIASCTQASSGRADACTAAYDCIRDRVPFADFKAADDALRAGRPVDPATSQAILRCVAESVRS
jgi:hypothetical protein